MCCFSVASPVGWLNRVVAAFRPRVHVSKTHIFARMAAPGLQALAYGMDVDAKSAVAMVLPLPIRPGAGEDTLCFIDLTTHPRMFQRWQAMFDPPMRKGGALRSRGPMLAVQKVGSFSASYVPSRADFSRLDPRFRIPEALFDAVPDYADYGFAVFQLDPGKSTVHPMGLTFKTRRPDALFFPTVHIHDGRFKPTAAFDHALYYQTDRCMEVKVVANTKGLDGDAIGAFAPTDSHAGLVVPHQPLVRRSMLGRLQNADTWIPA